MGSIWFSKKTFLYFGGALVIILGGLIVVLAPYHYVNFSVIQNDQRTFEVYGEANYYPQFEVSVSLRPSNQTTIYLDMSIVNNMTLEVILVNMTLTEENQIIGPGQAIFYEESLLIDIATGNYTLTVDRVAGATRFDLGLNQASNSRLFIVVGGMLNILGIIMVIGGYCLPGTLFPSDSDTIISWGYEEEKTGEPQQ
ncbi:MAG: hypothetical protein C4K48_02805 [Candidatus Thorarchaeota archaeon]|nr:MAG: hypothetical protein C4K48_02805 [Candidatus Thorarchaeota archaeon]